jgi:hypothetical protein
VILERLELLSVGIGLTLVHFTRFSQTATTNASYGQDIFENILQKSISLHHNGSTPVTMSEQSLYNITTAGTGDCLEIEVSKVTSSYPMTIDGPGRNTATISNTTLTPTMSLDVEPLGTRTMDEDQVMNGKISPRFTINTKWSRPRTKITCGNCRRAGHTIRDCVGPVDEHGEINGCPKCNTTRSHIYDECPLRDTEEDFDLIYVYRQRKPPIKSYMSWTSFLSSHQQPDTWPKFIPWSAEFAFERQELAYRAHRKPEWFYYDYDRIGWPEVEAHDREIDPESEFMVL